MTLTQQLEQRKSEMYFIALNKDIELAGEVIRKGLDLPVDIKALATVAQLNTDFDFKAILRNMCLILGLDPEFKLNHVYKKIIEGMIKSPNSYALSLGVASAQHKQYIDAICFFKASINFSHAPYDSYFHLGRIYYQMSLTDDNSEAYLKHAESALLLADSIKSSSETDYLLSIIYFNLKNYQSARRYAMKALSGNLDEQTRGDLLDKMPIIEDKALYERGYSAIINERYQEGLEYLLSISEDGEDDWRVQFFIGVGYRAQGDYSHAIMHLNKSRDLNAARPAVYSELGNCYMSLGDMIAAKDELAEGLQLFPLDIDLILAMSLATYYTGDKTLAMSFYEKAVDIDDSHVNLSEVKSVIEGDYDD